MRVAIIGGGISGIASAFYLLKRNHEVDLYESKEQIGGRAGSDLLDGRWVDFGGKNIGKNYIRFREFVETCNNPEFEYFGINTSQLINGRIVKLNRDGAKLYNLIKVIHLCGLPGFIKIYPHIKAILHDRSQGVLASDHFKKLSDQSDNLTLAEYLPRRCIDNVVRPITIRMNGAEPDECYPGNFGSNLSLVVDSYEQLVTGMHQLLNTFISRHINTSLKLLKEHRVISVTRNQKSLQIGYRNPEGTGTEQYDRIISALPAHDLATLLDNSLPEAANLFRQINYFPVGIAIVKYKNDVFPENRRAMIFDRDSPLSNAGAYGINDLNMVRYTYSGRISRSIITEQTSPETVIGLGETIASPYFNIAENCKEAFVYKYFSKGLCGYSAQHHLLLEKIDRIIEKMNGFGVTGDYRRGASIEACFRAASECVDNVIGD